MMKTRVSTVTDVENIGLRCECRERNELTFIISDRSEAYAQSEILDGKEVLALISELVQWLSADYKVRCQPNANEIVQKLYKK